MDPYPPLLFLHALSGSVVLLTAVVAILSKSFDVAHKWHIYSGIPYTIAMVGIFLTGMPMALLRNDIFTFLIGIFTFYFVVMGWRFAKNRKGTPSQIDWVAVGLMMVASVGLVLGGIYGLVTQGSIGIVLVVFGIIGLLNARADWQLFRAGGVKGSARISAHMNRMLPATIAAVTAFTVINFRGFEPAFVVWLAPTAIITPIIIWWDRRLKAGKNPTGMVN